MACVKVELSRQNRKAGATLFAMNKITQDMLAVSQVKQVIVCVTLCCTTYKFYKSGVCSHYHSAENYAIIPPRTFEIT